MSAFVQPFSHQPGDLLFGSHMEAMANTPYLMIPPSSRLNTASPISRSNMLYQPSPSQAAGNSFFEEAMDTTPVSVDIGFGSSYMQSPAQPPESIPQERVVSSEMMLHQENNKKSSRRSRARRQSQQSQSSSISSESSAPLNDPTSPKPRKRGRKPKKQSKESKTSGKDGDLDDEDDLPSDPRRRRILERNRIAATKCRLRKRDEASALASREQAMEDQNRYLSSCFDSLTAEIYHLKTELLKHTDCNCTLIQKYIANEAKKSVDGLLSCSSTFAPYGGSMSPEYGSSSSASTAESLNLQSPEADGIPPTWTNPFQQGHRGSEIHDDVFDMGLDPFQKVPMHRDSMVSVHSVPDMSLVGCDANLYMNMGLQEHQPHEQTWEPRWEIR